MDLFIITGASRGLGRALLETALTNGHHCIGISRSSMEAREGLMTIPTDVSDLSNLPGVMRTALAGRDLSPYASLHLVNNAAVVEPVGFTENLDAGAINRNIDINLTAPMILTSEFLRLTQEFKGPRTIVNISSGVAENAKENWSAYSAAKGGLRLFSHALAKEASDSLPRPKTRVISFSPGIMDTQMQETIRNVSATEFPDVERFRDFKIHGNLLSPKLVAEALYNELQNALASDNVDLDVADLL